MTDEKLMIKSRINVLIIEDDLTQGRALLEAFKRDGYSAVLVDSTVKALAVTQRTEFQCMIVDCMLPTMNGVDLILEILPTLPHSPKIFLVTGIYKDRKFIKEAMARTKAESFFIKPFKVEDLLAQMEEVFAESEDPERPTAIGLYGADLMIDHELVGLMAKESTLHAFHLPKLYQCIQDTKLSGALTLISAIGEISSVGFFEGRVFSVKTPDKESFFGGIAVSQGFVSPEEVLEALKHPDGKLLGEKLIASMTLSPHAIQVILEEQLALRLSQTIRNDVVTLQWETQKPAKPKHTLASKRLDHLIEDWLESKITPDWLKSTLMQWGAYLLEGEYHPRIHGSFTIGEVFGDLGFQLDKDLVPMFRALIKNLASIGARGDSSQDFTFLESRLDKMAEDFQHQNYFQFLGVGEKAQQREVSKAFEGFKESFNPESLPAACPPEVVVKCNSVFVMLQKAYDTLSNEVERQRYLNLLQSRRSQEMLDAEPIFRAAITEVTSGHAKDAAKKFQALIDRKLEFKDLRAYRIWAGIKCDRTYSAIRLDQIPPEERHSAPYMMAKGVFYRRNGQYKKALDSFRTAHILDPRLEIARHELKQLGSELQKKKAQNREMFNEVTSVFENLFGRSARRGA